MQKLTNNKILNALFALLLALSVGVLAGCEDQGPAEEAGENIDEAMEDAADEMEDAADEVEEEIDDNNG
ncbi:hypothetical protein G4Y73_07105 [Wenzhouxiangella sp. XN201]|uniref:hypothetical protein n=1 Tax=Wenzhouxiangella sp. XN201 TaxID=2710755 RepID=UPI0013C617BD|nr:hypothetical protein [Wenzhouxiangella sp. XN201]NEZ03917.1 hypothetical protein [Wenzhouxiangella sp. XN201]